MTALLVAGLYLDGESAEGYPFTAADVDTRGCRKCGAEKPLTEAHWYMRPEGGFRPDCIECCVYLAQMRRVNRRARHAAVPVGAPCAFPMLPAGPLAAKIGELVARDLKISRPWIGSVIDPGPPTSLKRVCDALPVSADRVRKWMSGATRSVDFETADAVLQSAGWLWWDVWAEPPCPPARGQPRDVLAFVAACEVFLLARSAFEGDLDAPGAPEKTDLTKEAI